ncbi:MAG: hypothetical protein GEU26_05445 [Nitrososphaeraceae archaeon]|nr:hypothetical protein [Nitrososphaeraceae archaeon]
MTQKVKKIEVISKNECKIGPTIATAKSIESIDNSTGQRKDVKESEGADPQTEVDEVKGTEEKTHALDLGEYYIDRAIDTMEEWHSKPRDFGHVSDVVMCHRQRLYREIDRRPLGSKNVSIYSSGKAIHEAVQLLFRSDKRTFEIEKYVEFKDILGSVDIYDRKRNIPIEFKTSRASDIKEPKSFHVDQLKYYMSMLGAEQGYIIYQLLMHFEDTPFKTFRILMNAQERKDQRDKLVKEVNSLKRAIEARDPSLARPVNHDPSLNWLCKSCEYLADCKKIQQTAAVAA